MHVDEIGKVAELARQLRTITDLAITIEENGTNFVLKFVNDVLPRGEARQEFIREVTGLVKKYSYNQEQSIRSQLSKLNVEC